MRKELDYLIEQLKETWDGDPWFGRSVKALLADVNEQTAFIRPNSQHSILDLVWHMVTWREFTIHSLRPLPGKRVEDFEEIDWRQLDHANASLWQEGLRKLDETQAALLALFQQQDDAILEQPVNGRSYTFRKLLYGIIQHDIYHLGQIAYINKQFPVMVLCRAKRGRQYSIFGRRRKNID